MKSSYQGLFLDTLPTVGPREHNVVMPVRRKRSISLPPELDQLVEAAARSEGVPVSVWLVRSAEDRFRILDSLTSAAESRAAYRAVEERS